MSFIPLRRAAAAAAGALLLSGCAATSVAPSPAPSAGAADESVSVATCDGDATFDAAPTSVVTIGTTAVRNLDSAGAGAAIVARSGEFGASLGTPEVDARYADVPILDPSDPTLEALTGTDADLIVGYGLYNTTDAALADVGMSLLQNLGDCGHSAEGDEAGGDDLDVVFDDILRLGKVFRTEATAQAAVSALTSRLEELAERAPAGRESAVILYHFGGSLGSHGKGNVSNAILDRAGFDNVFAEEPGMYIDPTVEAVIGADPDWVILSYGAEGETYTEASSRLLAEPGIAQLRAVKDGHVLGIPTELFAPTADAVDGVAALIDARIDEAEH
ncbi:ABC transporter substrate-binding protein [Microbacterium sp.]|uniref:ABC transporter substrate-binding protein n=1 Tax=Microbacterium sp. TaxID=51671 RepID=UPI0039E3EE92